jgi:transposase
VAADDALQARAKMVGRINKAGDRVTHTLIGVAAQAAIDNFCEPGSRG